MHGQQNIKKKARLDILNMRKLG